MLDWTGFWKKCKNYPRTEFLIPELFSNRPITHFSMLSGSQGNDSLESNMAARRHIGFKKCRNNPRNEFPISKLCKIDPLHTFQPFVFQTLIIALNPIWLPAAILDLGHFPGSDWWGFLGCDYWGTKGMKSAEKPFVRIFSTLSITVGLDWLGYNSIFILHWTLGFNILCEDNCKPSRETFKFWDLVRLVLESLR